MLFTLCKCDLDDLFTIVFHNVLLLSKLMVLVLLNMIWLRMSGELEL